MYHKLQTHLALIIVFTGLCFPLFSQKIIVHDSTPLKTNHQINLVYESYIFDDEIILLCDNRKNGNLNILLVLFHPNKNIVREQIIGTSESYDRPVGLIKKEKSYWLLANSVKKGQKAFQIYELDQSFMPINTKTTTINTINEVTAFEYNVNNQRLFLTATIEDKRYNIYPRLIEYDLTNHIVTPHINFNNHTDLSIKPHQALFKECNQIKCLDDDCSEIILVGQETSENITDFWVAKVKDTQIVWEKMYKTRLGGDVGVDVFYDRLSNHFLIGGIGYNKTEKEKHDYNYYYRVLLLNNNGEILKSHIHKTKGEHNIDNTRSRYLEMKSIGNDYIISGQTEDIIYLKNGKKVEISGRKEDIIYIKIGDERITLSDLSLVLVDKNGNLKSQELIETKQLDVLHSSIILSPQKMLLIFSSNEVDKGMKILEVSIVN